MNLHRYWIKFNNQAGDFLPGGVTLGCGVTANSQIEALNLIKDKVFKGRSLPPIHEIVEDVDVSTLDAKHILPNMGLVIVKGIWFPLGYGE